jgi:HK97 family phage prohead protease
MDIEYIDVPFEVKAVDDAEGIIEGYGSVFDNVDQGKDIVRPGAFSDVAPGSVKMLWQHDPRQPIGVWDELTENGTGLKSRGRLAVGKVAKATEAYHLMKMGAISGLSIGYGIKPGGAKINERTGVRELTALKLYEVSIVTFPMNTRATARVKDATTKRGLEHLLRNRGFSASEAKFVAGLTSLPPCETPEGQPDVAPIVEKFAQELRNLAKIGGRFG